MAQSDGQWGEVAWGDTDTVKEVESGVQFEEKRVVVLNSEEVIIMGDDE